MNTSIKTQHEHGTSRESDVIYISLKGIQGLAKKSLAFLFSTQANRKYELVDDHPDAIFIIDFDDFRGKAAWDEMQSHKQASSSKPTILIGLDPINEEGVVSLQKPFRTQDILTAIDTLIEQREEQAQALHNRYPGNSDVVSGKESAQQHKPRMSSSAAASLNEKELHAFIGSAADIDLDDPAAIAAVQYSPERFLAHHLGKMTQVALKERKYLQLGCCDTLFIVDPHKQCIHTDASPRSQRSLGALPMTGKSPAYEKLTKLPADMESRQQCFSWEAFIWRLALAGARGRLPEDTSLDQRYVLRRWPNLTRLMLFPHATRISAAWVSAPLSLREILKELAVPQRYVFAFFSAASATGLLVEAEPASTARKEKPSPDQPSQRRGLFRRLLKTLYRKQGDNRT